MSQKMYFMENLSTLLRKTILDYEGKTGSGPDFICKTKLFYNFLIANLLMLLILVLNKKIVTKL
jgi:hypothetical protein